MVEIQLAARGHGILIEDDFLAKQFSLTEPMGAYQPSSLIDYLAGRPVEVEAIWGEPLRRGILKNVKMPELSNFTKFKRKDPLILGRGEDPNSPGEEGVRLVVFPG